MFDKSAQINLVLLMISFYVHPIDLLHHARCGPEMLIVMDNGQ